MNLIEKEALQAELSKVEAILRRIPASDIFGRMSFEGRKSTIEDQLKKIKSVFRKNAEIVIYFGGDPVQGSSSIRADFVTSALDSFQEIVSLLFASQHRNIGAAGQIPMQQESRLCISGMPRGSFGFILTEESNTCSLIESKMQKAVNIAANLIKTTSLGEDSFEEAIADAPERVVSSLKKFIGTLSKYNATIEIKTENADIKMDKQSVKSSNINIETLKIQKKENVELAGVFKGVTGLTRNFNFVPDREDLKPYISGKVHSSIEDNFLEIMNKEYMNVTCKGIFAITETSASTSQRTKRRYVLTDILPA